MADAAPFSPMRTHPLSGLAAEAPIVAAAKLELLADAARLVFRGREAAIGPAGDGFGVALPRSPNTVASAGERLALWLGPDEWLLIAPGEDAATVAAGIAATVGAAPHALVDVSHRQLAIGLSGPAAADVLAAGCPLDLDIGVFPVGAATRTIFAKTEIILARIAPTSFRIEVWRSFSRYLWSYLDKVRGEV